MKRESVSEWFSRRRLGLFLHFGLYGIEGWHEQDMMRRSIPRPDYEGLLNRFNPKGFDAEHILDTAEAIGAEYLCLTAKHHDGFCLWDSRMTDYKITNSPYGKDIVGQLASACHRRNFPLGLYYSVVDWHHPNYPNEGRHHELPGPQPGDQPDWMSYMRYLREQVGELSSCYGRIRHFFWDMNVPKHRDPSINDMLRCRQPDIVINDRGFDDGDFSTPERDYERDETSGLLRFSAPTEACNSVGSQSWGYRRDEDYFSETYLINNIDGIMARGGNYLLNVGLDGEGSIPERAAGVLEGIGGWYNRVKEAFGDAAPASEQTSNREVLLTRREKCIYVHLPSPVISEAVILPPISEAPLSATLLNTDGKLPVSIDLLPSFWQSERPVLRIKGLPRSLLAGGETLIIRLQFADLPESWQTPAVEIFQG